MTLSNFKLKGILFNAYKVSSYKALLKALGLKMSVQQFKKKSVEDIIAYISSSQELGNNEKKLLIIEIRELEAEEKYHSDPNWNSCVGETLYNGGFNTEHIIAYLVEKMEKEHCYKINIEFVNGSKYYRVVNEAGLQEWRSFFNQKQQWV